jgi:breast carcinoma-amplified sequence 3
LLIAYKSGLTLWTIEINGIANELFSIREHNICSACLLIYDVTTDDASHTNRPWLALAKSAGPPSIQIRSLKNDQQTIKILNLPGIGIQIEPLWIESNCSILICATHTFIVGYDLTKFNEKFFLANSYSSLPLSLSTRWLAFVDYRLNLIHQSAGGINGSISEQYASYTGAVLNAAKSISKSVVKIGESVLGYSGQPMNNVNINEKSSPPKQALCMTMTNSSSNAPRHRHGSGKDDVQAGIVTIIDTVKFFGVKTNRCSHNDEYLC